MSTEAPDTHSSSPAAEPLALKLTEGLCFTHPKRADRGTR